MDTRAPRSTALSRYRLAAILLSGGLLGAATGASANPFATPTSITQPAAKIDLPWSTEAASTTVGTDASTQKIVDTDGDGLSDDDELGVYHTSPLLADTDGDGYSDFRELIELGYDASSGTNRYNPRVADLPKLKIDIVTAPIIGAIFEDSSGTQQTASTSRADASSVSASLSTGYSTTIGLEASASLTVGASATSGPSSSATQSVSVSQQTTMSFDASLTQENQTTLEQMRSQGIEESRTTTGGFMRVGVVIANDGHVPFTLEHITLAASETSDGADPFTPVGTLVFDGGFQPVSLGEDQATGNLSFEKDDIDLGTVQGLLSSARSITTEPATYEIVNADGLPFPYVESEVLARTAKILIDYGPHRRSEFYQVSTAFDPDKNKQKLSKLMKQVLGIDYDDANGLLSVRGIGGGSGHDRWVVSRRRETGDGDELVIYDVEDADIGPYSLKDIKVKAGDELVLLWLEDADRDGIGYREELVHGTNPDAKDTDNDGLTDDVEIRESWTVTSVNLKDPDRYPAKVFSSPTSADFDDDGLSDAEERERGLDPYNPDTDGDGVGDRKDTENGEEPLSSTLTVELTSQADDGGAASDFQVTLRGALSAKAPNVVEQAKIDWGDGSDKEIYNTASGGNPTITIDGLTHDYPGPGNYTIKVKLRDDQAEANQLTIKAKVVLTEAQTVTPSFGWNNAWRTKLHVRELVDIDGDGKRDIFAIGNVGCYVLRGGAGDGGGFGAQEEWCGSEWTPTYYAGTATDPRFLVDLDRDGDLDIVGVDASDNVVRYGLNNGHGFDAPVTWITSLGWNGVGDQAVLIDIDGNGYPDFVHASRDQSRLIAYTVNGKNLKVTQRIDSETTADIDPGGFDRRWYQVDGADLDGDGYGDLVWFGNEGTFWKAGLGDGSFGPWTKFTTNYDYASGWRRTTHKRWVADVTGDGLPDIVGAGNHDVYVTRNRSTQGQIDLGTPSDATEIWTTDFTTDNGWREHNLSASPPDAHIYPRQLVDVNGDGYLDLVGIAGRGAAVSINDLGVGGSAAFGPSGIAVIGSAYARDSGNWWANNSSSCPIDDPSYDDVCDEFHPALFGDFDGDGRADVVGFGESGVQAQSIPYVKQFK